MKIMRLITVLAFVLATNATMAKIWRVNNITGVNANFTSLQAAHDAASGGDTIAVEGSAISYGNCTVIKPLTFIGPGFFLAENPYTQAKLAGAYVDIFYFNAGSQGSVLTGMTVGYTEINTSNIFLVRNYLVRSGIPLVIKAGLANIVVKQNYIVDNSSNDNGMSVQSSCSNIIITNNYIKCANTIYSSISGASNSNLEISQNVLNGSLSVSYSTITNNIMLNTVTYGGSNNTVNNNISDGPLFGNLNGNKDNVDMTTVFVGTGSTDAQWMLKASCPASAAGISGEDCGMFGGLESYVLSGIPAAPSIYFLTSPTSGSGLQGLPVHVKVKSHN